MGVRGWSAALVAAAALVSSPGSAGDGLIGLPAPEHQGAPLEAAIAGRRSVREFAGGSLGLPEVAQLLWAAQGVTHDDGLRAAPSAGALYPLELHVVVGDVDGLEPAVYRYHAAEHALERRIDGDQRRELATAALRQRWVETAPVVIVVTAVPARTDRKYSGRAQRYVNIETGHAAQNVCLQAVSLGLGSTVVGAFSDERVAEILRLPDGEVPVLLLPVGRPA